MSFLCFLDIQDSYKNSDMHSNKKSYEHLDNIILLVFKLTVI